MATRMTLLVGILAGGLGRTAAQECNLVTQLLPLASQLDSACLSVISGIAMGGKDWKFPQLRNSHAPSSSLIPEHHSARAGCQWRDHLPHLPPGPTPTPRPAPPARPPACLPGPTRLFSSVLVFFAETPRCCPRTRHPLRLLAAAHLPARLHIVAVERNRLSLR